MADERAEATMKHDVQLELVAEGMREADAILRLARRLYEAKMSRLDNKRHAERRGLVGAVLQGGARLERRQH